ncbi:MAG: DUF2318 domain-containing protein [Nitrospiraceae bacterium]|nr:MAG: DUF2318 domain-containing protein [Nitrospiraceae bacterium]
MMPFIYEAQLIGFKEGIKIGVVWLVFYSFLLLNDRKALIRPFYYGLVAAFLISGLSLFLPQGVLVRDFLSNIISMSFAFFLISSGAALLHVSGTNLFGSRVVSVFQAPSVMSVLVFLTAILFFLPDTTGSMYFLRELSLMRENAFMSVLSAVLGLFIASLLIFAVVKLYRPYWMGSFFAIPQLLLFLAVVKLLGSGIQGIAELSLIPSVQRGIMKFTHDFIHQVFVFLMVPDHPLLKTTVWNFIAFFFGPNFASVVSLFILLVFPFMFVYHSLLTPLPEPAADKTSERRKLKAILLSDRRKKALPVFVFIACIVFAWFFKSAETVSQIYIPRPKPVVVDSGTVVIPVKDPTMDLRDGRLHTFTLIHEGEEIRILIMKKSDNSLSVCLDACEICPPEGYGQRADHVVCVYCRTPIHIDTLGVPGGCNPIPLTASIDSTFVKITLDEILEKWGFLQVGTGKEELHGN